MELASLIEDLGKACGLELTLDEGRCTLRFDGEHDVTIERDGNAVILHGIAGDGGCLSNPDNLRILLTASFLGAETDGGALSVWERTGKSCSGSGLTPSRTIRTSKPPSMRSLPSSSTGKRASTPCRPWRCPLRHIHPRRDHG
ncbi:MAG: CesT family type III secretion system chaperone [Bilophila wadsworthia]